MIIQLANSGSPNIFVSTLHLFFSVSRVNSDATIQSGRFGLLQVVALAQSALSAHEHEVRRHITSMSMHRINTRVCDGATDDATRRARRSATAAAERAAGVCIDESSQAGSRDEHEHARIGRTQSGVASTLRTGGGRTCRRMVERSIDRRVARVGSSEVELS
jgi:hypothetical protein